MDSDFTDLYQQLFANPLSEPKSSQDVQDILHCIKVQHGRLDPADEEQLLQLSRRMHKMVTMIAKQASSGLASYTKA